MAVFQREKEFFKRLLRIGRRSYFSDSYDGERRHRQTTEIIWSTFDNWDPFELEHFHMNWKRFQKNWKHFWMKLKCFQKKWKRVSNNLEMGFQ